MSNVQPLGNRGRSPQRGANRQRGKVFAEGSVPYFREPVERLVGAPDALRRLLARYRRRRRVVSALAGIFLTLAVFIAGVSAAVAADRWLRLETTARLVVLAAIVTTFIVLSAMYVARPVLKRISYRRAASRLGMHFPQMREDLVSAVELLGDGQAQQGVSKSLIAAVVQGIARRAAALDHRVAVPLRPFVRISAVFIVVAGLFQAAWYVQPEAVENALSRLFAPGSNVPFFSYTKLDVSPRDCVVRTGDSVDVLVNTSGRPARTARLEMHTGAAPAVVRLACAAGRASWHSAPLFEDLVYRVCAGDALSDWYRVRVVPPPAVQRKSAVLHDPDYAGGTEHVQEDVQGVLQVIQGSDVTLQVLPVARGADAKLLCAGEFTFDNATTAMSRSREGILSSPAFTPKTGGECLIRLVDGYGLANRAADSIPIKVVPDELPRAGVKAPGRDVQALPHERVLVEAAAEDDLGLRGLSLAFRTALKDAAKAGMWRTRELKEGGITVRRLEGSTELGVAEFGLKPGDIIEYRSETSDYAGSPLMRNASSPPYRITVISESDHLEKVLARLRAIQIELLRHAARERNEAAATAQMSERAKKEPTGEEARSGQDRQRELARTTDAVAREVESMIPELTRNPSASANILSELEKLGRMVRSVATDPMSKASEKLGEASRVPADDVRGGEQQSSLLAGAKVSQDDAADELEKLARIADRLQRTGLLERLAEEAERLAARQREVKGVSANLGVKTAGTATEDLPDELKAAVNRLAAAQALIHKGVDGLSADIDKAAAELAHTKPEDARTAEEAGEKLRNDKVSETTDSVTKQFKGNILFSTAPAQEGVAVSLTEVAAILRRSAESEELQAIAKEIEQFIKRQTEINASIRQGIDKGPAAPAAPSGVTPAEAPEAHTGKEYQVREGDTLQMISKKFYGTTKHYLLIMQANGLRDSRTLNVGMNLVIPPKSEEAGGKDSSSAGEPPSAAAMGGRQMGLERDVREQAGALEWLAQEIEMFSSQTAARLSAAADEMKSGGTSLFGSDLPEGLKHGEKALALLKEAREEFAAESPQMEEAGRARGSLRALLMLQRVLIAQKQILKETGETDEMPRTEAEAIAKRVVELARKQSAVRVDASNLEKMLAQTQDAAKVVGMAGGKMDLSRLALEGGDTGKDTRVVQREAVALLEALIKQQSSRMSAMGLTGQRMMAMMQMMMGGATPGGNPGGGNAPILPAEVGRVDNEDWRKTHSRFEEQLGADFETAWPSEFRGLLEAYFDRLRKEPAR